MVGPRSWKGGQEGEGGGLPSHGLVWDCSEIKTKENQVNRMKVTIS